ncbi:MAG: hypothetical protein JEY99_09600 [Spirochaetales bacterium]|nr:hypothetical protein [Spirochaetales bacterium]
MRRVVLLILLMSLLFPLIGESGVWSFDPLFTRLPDNTIIPPGREYSHPFMGMEELDFIDDYLVRIKASGEEFRAFYEYLPGDADNIQLLLTFKGGESLAVQIVSHPAEGELSMASGLSGSTYLYYYSLPEGFFIPEWDVSEEDSEDKIAATDDILYFSDEESNMAGRSDDNIRYEKIDSIKEDEPEAEDVVYWHLCGYLRKM